MKHIDSHIHLYPETLMNAIYRYFQKIGWQLPFHQGVDEALEHLKAHQVEKAFLLLYAHKAGMSLDLNRWAYELSLKNPQLIPFGCFYPDDPSPQALVRSCLSDWGFAGFKLHFNVQHYNPDDPRYDPVYRGTLEHGGGIVMHIGTFPNPGEHVGAQRLHAVLRKFPTLKVMVAHLGYFQTDDFLRLMDRYPGVYLDTAFILGNPDFHRDEPLVTAALNHFPHRVVYGSDFPLIRHRLQDGLDYIDQLPYDTSLKQNLMVDNALRFLAQTP